MRSRVADQPAPEDCKRICEAASAYQIETCFLVPTETRSFSAAYEIQLQPEVLHEMVHWRHLSLSNLIITPTDCTFLVVKEAADYFLVGGDRSFVERVVAAPLSAAREAFDQAARQTAGNSRYLQLAPIADRYRKLDG